MPGGGIGDAVHPATVAAAIAACPTVLQAPGEMPGTWSGLQPPSTSLIQSAAFFTPAPVVVDATTYTITVMPLAASVPGTSALNNLTVKVAWAGSPPTRLQSWWATKCRHGGCRSARRWG